MNRRLILCCAIAIVTAAVAASSPTDAVRDVLLQNVAAFQRGDFVAIEKLWRHGGEVSVFESGYANYGWPDYRDHHLKPELQEMKNVRYTIDDIKPRVSGSMAWATFKYAISADYRGRRIDGSGVGTAVLEKSGAQWKIVHWHTSAERKSTP